MTTKSNFRQIQQRTLDKSEDYAQIPVNVHLTSVYDHSLHEAFSRVLRNKLMEKLAVHREFAPCFLYSQSPGPVHIP
jgi:Ras-related GTP-binding protein C/D